ncbi:MAG TPA: hypothetical protein VF288_02815 [Mycobacteriales bacterium]
MSTLTAPAARTTAPSDVTNALRRARAALALGTAAAVLLAGINLFVATSTDDGKFHHAGDYWLTADGIPYMLALLALLPALRVLQGRRDGRLGTAGITVASIGAVVLLAMFVYGLAAATNGSFGPTYVLASLATLIGVVLYAAGSWHARVLPRWLLVLWVVGWAVGSVLPVPGPAPLLLAAAYIVMAFVLPRRVPRP